MDDKDIRAAVDPCTLGAQTGPQTIIVRQVIGEVMKQKTLDIHVVVPERKPSIEQIVDVFVKEVEVISVDVIPNKVIVRGEFEVKAIYVACLPDQPVHAVELKHYKWTLDVDVPGARKGMDADASVVVEFVDYDVEEHTRAYRHKHHDMDDDCEDHDHDNCNGHDHGDCDDKEHGHHHKHCCTREFDVAVVLKVTVKVMTDREVMINTAGLPGQPKG